jgi:DNA-binding MarR family transcriptional regulator
MRPGTVAASPRIGYVVGRLDRALRREIGALVAPFGLTVPKYTALSILRDRPGLSNAQLARRTYVTPQSMNEVLMALEADGLIIRSRSAEHGRVVESVLSARGLEALKSCDRAVTHMENAMLADLDADEREHLLQALMGCVQRLAR